MLAPSNVEASAYRAALARPHTPYLRVAVTDSSGNELIPSVTYSDGSVSATLQSRVTRTLSLTVDRSYAPITAAGAVDYAAPFAPFGNRIKAYRGISWANGLDTYWPVFYGPLQDVTLNDNGTMAVTADDLAAEVVGAEFEAPTASATTLTVAGQVQQLITGALPSAAYDFTSATFPQLVPYVVWQTDRGQALDDIASSVGALWYPRADGTFTLRRVPWANTQTQVATLADGTDGVVLGYQIKISRTDVKNTVVYVTERQDGSEPLFYVSRDTDPTSPTYYKGPFGRKPLVVNNQQPLSPAQQKQAADTLLRQSKATGQVWSISTVPDASLELGDLIGCTADQGPLQQYTQIAAQQVITGFQLPLRESAAMSLTLRAYTPAS